MTCPACGEMIPEDSGYCDQCGIMLLICPLCGTPGTGKRCIHDGRKLQPSSEIRAASGPEKQPEQTLLLRGRSVQVQLKICSGQIIGRKEGPWTDFFSRYPEVSGRHALFRYNGKDGWTVQDLRSTNGTTVQGVPAIPDVPVAVTDGTVVSFASLEFFVELPERENGTRSDTVRI